MLVVELIKVEKVLNRDFITVYDLHYINTAGNLKIYTIVSRNKNLTKENLSKIREPNAVSLFIENKTKDKILLIKEFRMSLNDYVYSSVTGLIDPGEDFNTAVARELKEETGLILEKIEENLKTSYTSVGLTDETTTLCFCTVENEIFDKQNLEDDEDIVPNWYSKEEVLELLETERFPARTQAICYLWSNNKLV